MARTYLNTSDGMDAYAKRHGAQYEPATGKWYVDGEVPLELLGLLPRTTSKPHLKPQSPQCPSCGSQMVLRYRKSDKHAFFGCPSYPKCKDTIDYDAYLDSIEDTTRPLFQYAIPDVLIEEGGDSDPAHPFSVTNETKRIARLAAELLGGEDRAIRWLTSPKVAFKGRSPLEVMQTPDGCQEAEKLLRAIND